MLVVVYSKNGTNGLLVVDVHGKSSRKVFQELVDIPSNGLRRFSATSFVVIGSTTDTPQSIYYVDISDPTTIKKIRSSTESRALPT